MTFVLVHGGAHGAWCWERLLPHLARPAVAVDLPGRGSAPADLASVTTNDWADAVVDTVDAIEGEVVLVGHSLAGITLPLVAERVPGRLSHLVFVSCSVPPDGKTTLDVISPEIQSLAEARRGDPSGTVLAEPIARQMFCNDMSEEQARFVLDRLVAEAWGPMLEPTRLAGLARGIPASYVKLLRDACVSPDLQDEMIATIRSRGPCDVIELDAGHNAMVSRPEALARLLEEIAAR